MDDQFLELTLLSERLHRSCLDRVRIELDKLGDQSPNPIQAMILFKIGHSAMSLADLMLRGCYHGTNPSYNVKKLVESGYLVREQRTRDRRATYLRLTEKGHQLRRHLLAISRRQLAVLTRNMADTAALVAVTEGLRQIEQSLLPATDTDDRQSPRSAA